MELRQLRYFIRIAETGSFRGAASRLCVAQPALTRQVRALEDELGVILFERHRRGVTLTEAGEEFADRAAKILDELDALRLDMMSVDGGVSAALSFGTSHVMSRMLFGRLTESLKSEFPELKLSLVEAGPKNLVESLEDGRLDYILVIDHERRPQFVYEKLATDHLHLIGNPDDPGFPAGTVQLKDLADLPLIALRLPSGPRVALEREAARQSVKLRIEHEVDSITVIKEFVRLGMGYGVLSRPAVSDDVREGKFQSCRIRDVGLDRMLVSRRSRSVGPADEKFLSYLHKAIRQLGKRAGNGYAKIPNAMAQPVPAADR